MAESLINRADVASLFDLQTQGVVNDAQAKAAQNQPEPANDDEVDTARKSAENKILLKLQQQKKEAILGKDAGHETYQKDDGLQKKWAAASDGRMGHEAQAAALGWSNNGALQKKLTEVNKRMFQEHFMADPQRGTNTANALNRVAATPGFSQAATGTQQVGMIQKALVDSPKMEQPIRELLQTRFMQSPKADPQTKSDFLRFGMQQAARAGGTTPPGMKVAGDMLGTLARTNTIPLAQRAAMGMVQRGPENTEGMRNVDGFVQHPAVQQMPTFARGVATTLLAKSDGATPVREGFEQVAQDPKFRAQNPDMQARMFATIGSGRAGELRAMTDKTLQALQSNNFPTRTLQVGKFLDKMGKKAAGKGGAAGVDVEGLMKASKGSPFPPIPSLEPVEGLDDDEAKAARAKNRSAVIKYYNEVSQSYKGVGRRIDSAKYFEDVNQLPNLREAGAIDTTGQTPEDAAFINEKAGQAADKYKELSAAQKTRMRALKTTRISPQRRRMLERRARAKGAQPKYFTPGRNKVGGNSPVTFPTPQGSDAMPQAGGMARMPMAKQRTMANAQFGTEMPLDAASVLSQVPAGLPVQERMNQAKKVMAKQWEAQMKSVMQQILGASDPSDIAAEKLEQAPQTQGPRKSTTATRGKTDGWGIPRSFEADLGGTQNAIVRPVGAAEASDEAGAPDYRTEKYTGRTLIKAPTTVRDPATLMNVSWKDTQRGERALLRNLGWTQPMWDAKGEPGARWPQSMRTPFNKLGSTQREAVRQLGLTSDDWDKFVESISST